MKTRALINDTYRIDSLLGSGGSGTVYKAWHTRLQKHVVVKELNHEQSIGVRARRNEAEALKNVKSPYLPQVYDFITENGRAYTVMEYIEGESFENILGHGGRFSHSEIIKWYSQLASALQALHKKDVCHRDIKPANIMLTSDGDVCLIDFNSAQVKGNTVRFTTRSLGYASPEQYKLYEQIKETVFGRKGSIRHDDIDWKLSDIYSLGAAIYHILTGARPPEFADDEPPIFPALENYDNHNMEIAQIIKRSMHPTPAKRYTAEELSEVLAFSPSLVL